MAIEPVGPSSNIVKAFQTNQAQKSNPTYTKNNKDMGVHASGKISRDTLEISPEAMAKSAEALNKNIFKEETTNFTRSQILFKSNIAVLESANLIPQSILTLLS